MVTILTHYLTCFLPAVYPTHALVMSENEQRWTIDKTAPPVLIRASVKLHLVEMKLTLMVLVAVYRSSCLHVGLHASALTDWN